MISVYDRMGTQGKLMGRWKGRKTVKYYSFNTRLKRKWHSGGLPSGRKAGYGFNLLQTLEAAREATGRSVHKCTHLQKIKMNGEKRRGYMEDIISYVITRHGHNGKKDNNVY